MITKGNFFCSEYSQLTEYPTVLRNVYKHVIVVRNLLLEYEGKTGTNSSLRILLLEMKLVENYDVDSCYPFIYSIIPGSQN